MEMPGRMYNSTSNRYGYQGEYSEKDAETGLNTFDLRQFDCRLGCWLNPDPMYEFNNPYIGMGNNPVSVVDPTGGDGDQQAKEIKARPMREKYPRREDNAPPAMADYAPSGGSFCGGENSGPNSVGYDDNSSTYSKYGYSIGAGSLPGNNFNGKSDEVRHNEELLEIRDKLAQEKMRIKNMLDCKGFITYMGKPHPNFGNTGPGDDPTIPKTRKERHAYLENFYNAYFRDKIDPKLRENVTKIKYSRQNPPVTIDNPDQTWGTHDKRLFHKGYVLIVYKFTFDYGSNYEIFYTVGHELSEIAYEMEDLKISPKTNYKHNVANFWESEVGSPDGKDFIDKLRKNSPDEYDESKHYYEQIQKYNIPLVIPHFE